jgi:hypothetical protein
VDGDFTVIKSNKPKNSPKPTTSHQALPSPANAAPKSSSKPTAGKANAFAHLASDSEDD